MDKPEIYNMTLKTPFNMIISGASGSGKTTKLLKLLKYKDILFNSSTSEVHLGYNEWQDTYDVLNQMQLVNNFYRGIPTQDELMSMLTDLELESNSSQPHQLLIFDDLISEIQDDLMVKLFTVFGHHKKCVDYLSNPSTI